MVTALFCDMVGFTPIAESLDPEDIRDLQAAYFEVMASLIARYGGVVEKYAGDAVLALFGVPVAHEDDAERAVLCALGMQQAIEPIATNAKERWQVEPQIRVGLNTGEVVSGTWDASGRQDIAVTGDALNTAARIQAVAEPGETLTGAETMRLTRRRVRYGERREASLKGKATPVPVWPALGIREEFGERWEGYETPFVGRDREMVQLLDSWVRAQAGEGQLVTIVGEAGVGKSRLVAEFLGTVAASASVRVVRARSLSYGQEISLWLVADLLRSVFGISQQETQSAIGDKLRGRIAAMLPSEETRAEALDVLGEVLGLPIGDSSVARAGPQVRRRALIRSLRSALGAIAERAATVLVLEDLHWMDKASNEILTDVLADVLGSRILVLAAHRPGWIAPWNEWGWPERLTLRPLAERDAASLAAAVLGGARLSEDLARRVSERAAGNPFFLEEMLRTLQETDGLSESNGEVVIMPGAVESLPSTLTEVLLARLDRLEPATKDLAQVASVIGRSFAVPLLARVTGQPATALDEPLGQLQQTEIAYPRRTPDLEYVFKHVSMRDAAYNTLVHKRRAELHLQTGRAIASLYPSEEYVEIIAYHYAKTDAPEAVEWLERAGDRAAAIYANVEALGHYGEASRRLAARDADMKSLERLDEKLGTVSFTAGRYDEALEYLGPAADAARARHDLEAAGRIVAAMGMVHRYRGTPDEGIALVTPMVELLAWSGPSEPVAALHIALASLYFLVGRYRDQQKAAARAAEVAREIGDNRLLGEAEERRGVGLQLLGYPESAVDVIQGAIPLIEAGGDLATLSRALTNLGEALKIAGEIEKARSATERAIEISERVGNPARLSFDLGNLADILIILGEWRQAALVADRALALVGDKLSAFSTSAIVTGGMVALRSGDPDEAARRFAQGLTWANQAHDLQLTEACEVSLAEIDEMNGRPHAAVERLRSRVEIEGANLGLLLPALARALLAAGLTTEAAEVAERAVEQVRVSEPLNLVNALRVRGLALRELGRPEDAEKDLEEALDRARALPYPYAEAAILEALGRTDEAVAIYRRLGAKRDLRRLA